MMAGHLPAEIHVRQKWDQYRESCHSNGRRPSVLAFAVQLNLSNTTFRRHFPTIAKEISATRAEPDRQDNEHPSPYDTVIARNARLRHANRNLSGQLKLAAAQIQRLGIENAQLRRAVEANSNVTRIDRPDRPRSR